MKKIFLSVVALIVLSSCNRQIVDFRYNFNGIYLNTGTGWVYLEIDSWRDYGEGSDDYQFMIDGVAFIVNSRNFIMVEQRTTYFDEMLGIK
jgi:hypothetical protein